MFVDRHLWLQDSPDEERGRSGGEWPGFEFLIFSKAVEERADMFGDLPGPVATKPQRLADGLVSIAQDSLRLLNPDGEHDHRSDPFVSDTRRRRSRTR